MKKFIIVGLIIVVLVAAGWFLTNQTKKQISEKVGEEMMEKTLEAQTGAKVDIDAEGDDVTIKTEDGETQYSAGGTVELPDNFPQELVIAGDAKLILSSSSDAAVSVTYLTNYDQTAVFEKYISDLPGSGWKKDMEIDAGQGKMMNFSRGSEGAVINIGDNNTKDRTAQTLVNITWTTDTGQ